MAPPTKRLGDTHGSAEPRYEHRLGSHMRWGPNSQARSHPGWAGLGITLAETQEIKREIFRQNDQIRLQVIRRESRCRACQQARLCLCSNVRPVTLIQVATLLIAVAAIRRVHSRVESIQDRSPGCITVELSTQMSRALRPASFLFQPLGRTPRSLTL